MIRIEAKTLGRLTDQLSRALLACLVENFDPVPVHNVAIALTANVLAKARVLSEAEAILVFDRLRDKFRELEQQPGKLPASFQLVVVNPWSDTACVTCTDCDRYIRVGDGSGCVQPPTVFVSLAINVSALVQSLWPQLTRPATGQ